MNKQETVKCQRCLEQTPFETKKLVIFWGYYDEKATGTAKWLCPDCYEMVEYASSTDSWLAK
jgi:hypothetical protein